VLARLDALTGPHRNYTRTALRVLFAWAKRTGQVFRNPMLGIAASERARPLVQPLADDALAGLLERIDTPDARLAAALAAIHAASHEQIRRILLDDVDLAADRISVGGESRPLDPITRRLIEQWLRYRRERWPGTANPHLLITFASAMGHAPVCAVHLSLPLRALGLSLEKLRAERCLEEAVHTRGDALQVAEVFGINPSTAIRYAHSARALLAPEPGHDPDPAT
jgi:hypothetical protein